MRNTEVSSARNCTRYSACKGVFMAAIRKIANVYGAVEKWTLIVMMGVLVIVIFAQVFTRYVMGNALYWSEELGRFIFVWMSWLGVSAGLKEKEHIQVKLFPAALNKRGFLKSEKVVYLIVDILWFITSIVVMFYGLQIIAGQFATGVYGASTGIPMWIAYLCIPASAVPICLRLIGEIIISARYIVIGPSEGKEVANG